MNKPALRDDNIYPEDILAKALSAVLSENMGSAL